jgi:pyruvate/2-oxoglutarate dehydrogenase complex dihydrolipoamide dehydrogenase (E3) component
VKTYDAVVIGAGDVGCSLAFKAAGGGTCLNNGCVPSKTLAHAPGDPARAAAEAAGGPDLCADDLQCFR